jgi:hypothetical protein
VPGIVAKDPPNVQDLTLEAFRLNVRVGPNCIEQLVLRHKATGTLD